MTIVSLSVFPFNIESQNLDTRQGNLQPHFVRTATVRILCTNKCWWRRRKFETKGLGYSYFRPQILRHGNLKTSFFELKVAFSIPSQSKDQLRYYNTRIAHKQIRSYAPDDIISSVSGVHTHRKRVSELRQLLNH